MDDLGSYDTAKNAVAILRRKLSNAFGLDDDPFHELNVAQGWRAKFFAGSEIAGD